MKRAVTLFAVIAALGLVFTGCKKKPAEEKGDDTTAPAAMDEMMEPAMDEMTEPAMDEMMAAGMDEMDAMAGGTVKLGIPECDGYIKIMTCYLSKLPAASRGPAKAGFDKSIEAWKKMASGPARASLAKTCKMSEEALRKSAGMVPTFADCFK